MWKQTAPLTDLDYMRGKIRRSCLIKLGMAAFEMSEADLGNQNDLADFNDILAMPTEDIPIKNSEEH